MFKTNYTHIKQEIMTEIMYFSLTVSQKFIVLKIYVCILFCILFYTLFIIQFKFLNMFYNVTVLY